MTIEILGSGGAVAVPRAFCECRVCREALENPHPPFVRHSPSLYIHDLELLVDTPEEIRVQLTRSGIKRVRTALYTHWHPDHTAGIRVFEGNYNVEALVDRSRSWDKTRVILPDRVAETFGRFHALSEKLGYLERRELVTAETVECGVPLELTDTAGHPWTLTPVALPEEIAVGYLVEGSSRVFICMDEIKGFDGAELGQVDAAILPCGYFVENPISGEPIIAADHPVLAGEPSFDETLEIGWTINAGSTTFLHLNHGLGLTPADYEELENRLKSDSTLPPIRFAEDMMKIVVD